MSQQHVRWAEKQAEQVATEFLSEEHLPDSVKKEVAIHLERDEPIQALELALEASDTSVEKLE